jgi:hypothetical protein
MRALRGLVLPSITGVALVAYGAVVARADTPVAITHVPDSIAEASIANGPWTLHSMLGRNPHDASGILPPSGTATPFNPPTTAFGTPYKNYCIGGQLQTRDTRALI